MDDLVIVLVVSVHVDHFIVSSFLLLNPYFPHFRITWNAELNSNKMTNQTFFLKLRTLKIATTNIELDTPGT